MQEQVNTIVKNSEKSRGGGDGTCQQSKKNTVNEKDLRKSCVETM